MIDLRTKAAIVLRNYKGESWFLRKCKQDWQRGALTMKQARAVLYVHYREVRAQETGLPFTEWPFGEKPIYLKEE